MRLPPTSHGANRRLIVPSGRFLSSLHSLLNSSTSYLQLWEGQKLHPSFLQLRTHRLHRGPRQRVGGEGGGGGQLRGHHGCDLCGAQACGGALSHDNALIIYRRKKKKKGGGGGLELPCPYLRFLYRKCLCQELQAFIKGHGVAAVCRETDILWDVGNKNQRGGRTTCTTTAARNTQAEEMQRLSS